MNRNSRLHALLALLLGVLVLVAAPVAHAQTDDDTSAPYAATEDEQWRPKENFWWLFAAYAVIWVALLGYVGRMASKQQQLERELRHLQRES